MGWDILGIWQLAFIMAAILFLIGIGLGMAAKGKRRK